MHYRILFLGILGLLFGSLPNANALPPCLIQTIIPTYPATAALGVQVTINTHFQATCVVWPPFSVGYSIRVDLTDTQTNIIQSTTTYQVGYAQTNIEIVFVNTATAPTSPSTWSLRLDLYLFMNEQIIVHAVNYATIQVTNS
jgi:hypothetical protein